ncbi:hypothetical protein I3843_05G216100 [Carya illinoinensis]|uniref:Uncharacterized protein n=1 Tax=Carya illinoinensis TaxID=32201 RepID=A0A8T1QP85_CARIL|nr:uncharacterized protein LOC122311198 [Carya illinoinensis]KAG2709403.1 hypothetical protein I3760_05G237100 [Carya illinoinensis]KAG6655792.1 hypothetical protein CIPAW_05G241000 [Carya illinoinensis]KAG6715105.1 hypothetical protein I3842_05G233800 [Carya illinoinensis]KAG7981123.1 hypothetical protein I3843_05G216100 [Carya illinoinensis]
MATLQRFKLLATQCGVAPSPTRSPRTSPVVHFRRRKTTLRMLLSRTSTRRSPSQGDPPAPQVIPSSRLPGKQKEKNLGEAQGRFTLKDLFVSSSPLEETKEVTTVGLVGSGSLVGGGLNNWKAGPGSPRPAWTGFRYRSLLRKAWRPVLDSIPESE